MDKIKSGDFPKLYYSSKTDYLFFEGDYLPVGYAKAALLFTFVFPIIGTLIWRKELNNDIRTMQNVKGNMPPSIYYMGNRRFYEGCLSLVVSEYISSVPLSLLF